MSESFVLRVPKWRRELAATLEEPWFRVIVVGIICVNTLVMALERAGMPPWQQLIVERVNLGFTAIYTVEMAVKLVAKVRAGGVKRRRGEAQEG